MTEKDFENFKLDILSQLKATLESNIQQRITIELATGIYSVMENKINEKTFTTKG